MKHGIKHKKLNRTSSHMKALLRNMTDALVENGRIKTTVAKAKNLKPYVEKLITKAKQENIDVRRRLNGKVFSYDTIVKLFAIADLYNDTPGGYLRIVKLQERYGDNAPMAYIEFVKDIKAIDENKLDAQKEE